MIWTPGIATPSTPTVHQSGLSVRTSARAKQLQEVVEARGHLLVMLRERTT